MSIINIDQIGTNRGDEKWSDLNVGNIGTPVYFENGMPKPCNIIDGEAGADGSRGIQGIVGHQGLQGVQGKSGAQGVQGLQGKVGVQGLQGRIGTRGSTGMVGAQGLQGLQGLPGIPGTQGTRGCVGLQGPSGMAGSQGIRGKSGLPGYQGLIGSQGIPGIQGLQGTRGKVGERGYMGYQGKTGELGIQGVNGEKGAVWVDGVRMDGYNTHLYGFDRDQNKFVSLNIDTKDLMYLKPGAKMSIWLDSDAYASIKANKSITVDSVILGQESPVTFPVYYAGTRYLSDVIVPSTDINTIVDLVFSNDAWYYSGGLLTQTITSDITVAGVELGQLHDGAVVKAGTTIQDLFTNLLVKEIDVDAVSPKSSIRINNDSVSDGKIYEIGDTINIKVESTYTDGQFVPKQGYDLDKFIMYNGSNPMPAQCAEGVTTYYMNGNLIQNGEATINVDENRFNFSSSTTYNGSTAVVRTNVGNISGTSIASGSTTASNSISIIGRYKFFYGIQISATESNIDDETTYQFTSKDSLSVLTEGWINSTGNTVINKIESTSDKPTFVIVVPEVCEIASTKNSLGQIVDVDTTWYKQNTISYTNNGVTTTYQVYISPSTIASNYQDITLRK